VIAAAEHLSRFAQNRKQNKKWKTRDPRRKIRVREVFQ
jgi:hypothetical protein